MKYQNPVIPGFHPDPSICRVGEDYYLVTSSFEYFPGVPVYHSRDLVNWRQIGHCLTRPNQLPLEKERSSGGIYAPTLRYHDGTFYMVTTNVWFEQWPDRPWHDDTFSRVKVNRGPLHFYVHTKDPAGEWSEPVWSESHVIDPSLFFDDDGKVYFTCNGPDGIYQWLIDIRTGERLSDIRHIWQGSGGCCAEGPHLYRMFGWYYLLAAEGGTEYGHMETIARSQTPWGPWEPCPFNPILTHRNCNAQGISGTGHGDLVQAHDGSWWMVFLAFRCPSGGFHHLGRETFLAPVRWTPDGWPVVGGEEGYPMLDREHGKGTVRLEMDGPTLPRQPWPIDPARDDFDLPELRLCWNFLRNPRRDDWSLTQRPGFLRLNGSAVSLDDVDSPAFVGRRQEHFDCRAATLLEFSPTHPGEEAGLTVLMNESHHYEIAVTCDQDEPQTESHRCVIVRRRIGSLQAVVARQPIAEGPVMLEVRADAQTYTFACSLNGEAMTDLATGTTRHLSSEVAGGFTGVYFGMYATAHGRRCSVSADFDWFEYDIRRSPRL